MKIFANALNRFGLAVFMVGSLISYMGCLDDSSDNTDSDSEAVDGKNFDNENIQYGSFTDPRDGHVYKTVKIGDLVWMAENLNYDDGESLCYKDSPDSCAKYGRLYTWLQATAAYEVWSGEDRPSPACPEGWRLPEQKDFYNFRYVVEDPSAIGTALKSKKGWSKNGNGTNVLGFNALPAGYWDPSTKEEYSPFRGAGTSAWFWTSDRNSSNQYIADWMNLDADSSRMIVSSNVIMDKSVGISVRCIQKEEADVPVAQVLDFVIDSITDKRDGRTYKTVTIGSQTWMAENLNYKMDQGGSGSNSYCYNDSPDSCAIYGRLYTWAGVMENICPEGWHVPTKMEWKHFYRAIGGSSTIMGHFLSSEVFNVMSAGIKWGEYAIDGANDGYINIGLSSYFWTASEYSIDYAYSWSSYKEREISEDVRSKANAMSVRCIKD